MCCENINLSDSHFGLAYGFRLSDLNKTWDGHTTWHQKQDCERLFKSKMAIWGQRFKVNQIWPHIPHQLYLIWIWITMNILIFSRYRNTPPERICHFFKIQARWAAIVDLENNFTSLFLVESCISIANFVQIRNLMPSRYVSCEIKLR